MRASLCVCNALLAAVFLSNRMPALAAEGPLAAPVRPVTDDYFGTVVTDNYRYMENLQDPGVQEWMKAQNSYTRKVLGRIPGRAALAKRIQSMLGNDLRRTNFRRRGELLFYEVQEAGAELPKLAYRDGLEGEEHILVDPAKLSTDISHHFALDWYSPSWDARYVAYGISEGGSEKSVLHLFDLKTGSELPELIDRTEDGGIAWRPDNQSFYYMRYSKPGPATPPSQTMYNAVTYLHVVGQNTSGDGDTAVFGRGVSPAVSVPEGQGTYIVISPDSRYAVAVANRNMDSNPNTFYVAPLEQVQGPGTPWQKIASTEDGVVDVQPHGERLYLLSQKDASRFRLLSVLAAHPDLEHADVIVPEGLGVLDGFAAASDALYLAVRTGVAFELQRVKLDGKGLRRIQLPFSGTVADLTTDPRLAGVLFNLQGWVTSAREMSYDLGSDAVRDTGLIPPARSESNAFEASEEFAVSYDGTRIPVSILSKKGSARDRSHAALVYAYGSYGISMDPFFERAWLVWLERGGIVAVVHARGGGEYGDAWHRAGQKLRKINTILDFNAGAQYLIDRRYTQSKLLVANSASAGGIIMGGALTVDPGLFRVVLDDVGLSDMLRFETEPNGPPNVPELGSASEEEGFHALYSVSAYAHIHDGTPYPAVMFTTGANDPRVGPANMLKMTARVQAATSSGRPVLLRVDYDAGHGFGSSLSQTANLLADEWAFAFWQLGLPGFQPAK